MSNCLKTKLYCPTCREWQWIEEVMSCATMSTVINTINDAGDVAYNNKTIEVDSGEVERYQCRVCGWIIPDVTTGTQLYIWLRNHLHEAENTMHLPTPPLSSPAP